MDTIYKSLCLGMLEKGTKREWGREQFDVRFRLNGKSDMVIRRRKMPLPYLAAEMTWQFSGASLPWFLEPFDKVMAKKCAGFAYGQTLFSGRVSRFNAAADILIRHPENSCTFISLHHMSGDYPGAMTLQFFVRDHLLHLFVSVQSCDLWNRLPYDVIFFSEVQKKMAQLLCVGVGMVTFNISQMFVEEDHVQDIKDAMYETHYDDVKIEFSPLWYVKDAIWDNVLNFYDDPKKGIMKEFRRNKIYVGGDDAE